MKRAVDTFLQDIEDLPVINRLELQGPIDRLIQGLTADLKETNELMETMIEEMQNIQAMNERIFQIAKTEQYCKEQIWSQINEVHRN